MTFSAAWVVDEKGSVVVRTGDAQSLRAKDVPASGSVTLSGVPYVAYRQQLTEYPYWAMIGLVSYEAINAPVRSLTLVLMTVSAVLLVALVTIGGSISSRITKPLRELAADVAELGRGSWQPTGARSGAIEIEDLLTGYNAMVDSLHALTDEITRGQIEKRKIKVAHGAVAAGPSAVADQPPLHPQHTKYDALHGAEGGQSGAERSDRVV